MSLTDSVGKERGWTLGSTYLQKDSFIVIEIKPAAVRWVGDTDYKVE
jgi:hypothetical protein